MTINIQGRYLGNKKIELTHGPSTTKIYTAAPLDNNGDGSSFSPTDLCAASLGSCIVTIMGIVAERNSIDLSGTFFEVTKEMSQSPRRIGKLTVTIHLPSKIEADNRKKLEHAAGTCPVSHSLHPDVIKEITILFDL